MGIDIGFYIQKNVDNEWKDVSLYRRDNVKVMIWRNGRGLVDDIITPYTFGLNVDENEIEALAKNIGWMGDDDNELPPHYAITLSKLKYFANKPDIDAYDTDEEYIDKQKFYKYLVDEIEIYLRFTNDDYIDEDNIRIIAFVSY